MKNRDQIEQHLWQLNADCRLTPPAALCRLDKDAPIDVDVRERRRGDCREMVIGASSNRHRSLVSLRRDGETNRRGMR